MDTNYSTGEVLSHSGLVMNIKTHECLLNEQPLVLTPTEFSILQFLLEHKGNVVSSEELFHHIWNHDNSDLQMLKEEVSEKEYQNAQYEAEKKKHISYWLKIIAPFIMIF